jgi:hypothetical protein
MKKSRETGSGIRAKPHSPRRVPDLYVEQLLLDELPEGRRRQLAADPQVRRRLEELKASNRKIMTEYPAAEMARRIEERAQAAKAREARERARGQVRQVGPLVRLARFAPAVRFAGPAAALAAVIVVVGLLVVNIYPGLRGSASAAAAGVEQARLKGGSAHLVLYRQTAAGAEALRDNDVVRQGDMLQIGYVGAGTKYGVILSLDGRGVVTVHHPPGAASSAALEPEGETLLSSAYELDDAPGFERFFLVSSEGQFAVQTVVSAAQRLAGQAASGRAAGGASGPARTGRLALPGSMAQASFLLLKKD